MDQDRISPVVEKVYALDQIAEAERQVETKHSRGKVVVRLDGPPQRPGGSLGAGLAGLGGVTPMPRSTGARRIVIAVRSAPFGS